MTTRGFTKSIRAVLDSRTGIGVGFRRTLQATTGGTTVRFGIFTTIGIRIALGAGAGRVLQTIARRAAIQLAWGIVFGAALGAWILSEIAGDREILEFSLPGVLVMVSGAVVLIVCVACSRPILRGLKVDPTGALREG